MARRGPRKPCGSKLPAVVNECGLKTPFCRRIRDDNRATLVDECAVALLTRLEKEGLDGGRETVLYVRCGLVIQKNRSIGMCSENRGGASSADCFVEGALDNLRLALA